MSTAFTPGPWRVDPAYAADVQTADGRLEICTAEAAGYQFSDGYDSPNCVTEAHANARLIAAAPELVEACQAAWNCIAELHPTQARVEVGQMLIAVITKATGEAPT
jgi:hypothetical protein